MIQRFSKITMHSKVIAKVREHALAKYESLGIKPWHHLLVTSDAIICYIWDTRFVQVVLPVTALEQEDLTYAVMDNRLDIKYYHKFIDDENMRVQVYDYLQKHKVDLPVQFIDNDDDMALSQSIDQTQLA